MEVTKIETTITEANNILLKKLLELEKLWFKTFGKDSFILKDRYANIPIYVEKLLDEMIDEETNTLAGIEEQVRLLLVEYEELKTEMDDEIVVPSEDFLSAYPIFEQVKVVADGLEKYRILKQKKLTRLSDLRNEENELLEFFGRTGEIFMPHLKIPSEQNLDDFQMYLSNLRYEKVVRSEEFQTLKQDILKLTHEYGLKMNKRLLDEDEDTLLTDNVMKEMQEMKHAVEQKACNLRTRVDDKKTQLSKLWCRLETPAEEREAFIVESLGYKEEILIILEKEVQKCQVLMKQNIERCIVKARAELEDMWEKCHVGKNTKQEFINCYFYLDDKEKFYNALETEIKKLRNHFDEYREIYHLADKTTELRNEMLEMENKASDSSRLFDNRGGRLLQEEKRRNFLKKELPKLEYQLIQHLRNYELTNLSPFIYNDENLLEIIEERTGKDTKKSAPNMRKIGTPQNFKRITPQSSCDSKRLKTDTPGMVRNELEPQSAGSERGNMKASGKKNHNFVRIKTHR